MNRTKRILTATLFVAVVVAISSVGGAVAQDTAEITEVTDAEPGGEFEVTYEYEVAGDQDADTSLIISPEGFDVNIVGIEGDGTDFSDTDRDEADSRSNPDQVAEIVTFGSDGEATVTVDVIGGEPSDTGEINLEIANEGVDAGDSADIVLGGDGSDEQEADEETDGETDGETDEEADGETDEETDGETGEDADGEGLPGFTVVVTLVALLTIIAMQRKE
jgi:PGF-CTERM protein